MVDIEWRVQNRTVRGSGQARSKKAARRDAARQLLQKLPVSEDGLERGGNQGGQGVDLESGQPS